jgi:hypothetical protein
MNEVKTIKCPACQSTQTHTAGLIRHRIWWSGRTATVRRLQRNLADRRCQSRQLRSCSSLQPTGVPFRPTVEHGELKEIGHAGWCIAIGLDLFVGPFAGEAELSPGADVLAGRAGGGGDPLIAGVGLVALSTDLLEPGIFGMITWSLPLLAVSVSSCFSH